MSIATPKMKQIYLIKHIFYQFLTTFNPASQIPNNIEITIVVKSNKKSVGKQLQEHIPSDIFIYISFNLISLGRLHI